VSARNIAVVTLALCLLTVPLAAGAQQPGKVPRIGILPPGPISERVHLWEAFRQGLRDLGYKVDVIVAAATPAVQAAEKATRAIPIVSPTMANPLESRLVASLARPGGTITGLSLFSEDLSGKRLELLKTVVPKISRIAVLSNPTAAAAPSQMRETEVAARALGVQLQPLEVRSPDEFERVFQEAMKGRAGAFIALDDPLIFSHRTRIVRLAAKNRLPAIYGFREFVDVGGVMSYAANLADMYRRAATYVDKILKGAKPGDLPIEQPTKFELLVNLKTARALRLTIPQSILLRADQVIQ
jgi:putative ABC transport system substrate-binding protein